MTNDEILADLLQSQSRRKRGGCSGVIYVALALAMIAAFAILTADRLGYVPPSVMGPYVGTPQVQFSTPRPAPQPAGGGQPALVPFYRGTEAPVAVEAPTGTPEPTQGSFWTAEEQTQIAATATAFIEDVPTAEPAFVAYVDERCRDAGAVEESLTLQLFCKK